MTIRPEYDGDGELAEIAAADRLAQTIESYWRDRHGVSVNARISRSGPYFGVASNTINGRPREWQSWVKRK